MTDQTDLLVGQIAERHHGVFGAHHLRELDIPDHVRRHRLSVGRWETVHERVYRIVGTPLEWRGRVLGACWAGGTRGVASHRTAAELWELPGRSTEPVEITCPRWRRARHEGLVVHESLSLRDEDVTIVDGIPTTNVDRTLFDLAAVVRPSVVDLGIENALRRRLTSMKELDEMLTRNARRGRPGTKRFREALALHRSERALTESEAERLIGRHLSRHGLPEPLSQYEIRDNDGRLVARVDFAYPDLKIAIEYDSYAHHLGREALVRDGARRNAVIALGWLPITATANDVKTGGRRLASDLRRARALRTGVEVSE